MHAQYVAGSARYSLKINSFRYEFCHHPGSMGDLKLVPRSPILARFEGFAIIPPTTFQIRWWTYLDLPRTVLILKLKVSRTSIIPHKLGRLLTLLSSIQAPSCFFYFIVVCDCVFEGVAVDLRVFWAIWTGIWLNAVGRMGGVDGQRSGCGQLASFTK